VRDLALAVAGFVLALTFFTVSDASARAKWPGLKWCFLSAGLTTGVISTGALVLEDPSMWPWLLSSLIATPVAWLGLHYAVAFAERIGWVHSEETEGAIHSEELTFERAALRAAVLVITSSIGSGL
jgi:hypothetical protein